MSTPFMLLTCEHLKGQEILPSRFPKVYTRSLTTPLLSQQFTLIVFAFLDVKNYYAHHMPYVSAQPRVRKDVLASLLEKNANDFTIQQEWEAEWNQYGLSSRLSEEVGKKCSNQSVAETKPVFLVQELEYPIITLLHIVKE